MAQLMRDVSRDYPVIPVEDWNLMFSAVKTRLRLAATQTQAGNEAAQAAALVVLECGEALDRLQALLEHERRTRAPMHPQAMAPALIRVGCSRY
jgi:hypothetical protein